MAIIGTKPTGLIKTVGEINTTGGFPPRTGLIWWMFNGVESIESNKEQPALNTAALYLGKAAAADKAQNRTILVAGNDRYAVAP